jgi:putative oxidoreductase
MPCMSDADIVSLLLRLTLGGVMLAHGWNHVFGPGGVAGTARWFGSMGLAPPRLHALASGVVELAAGTALLLGLASPLACAGVVGVMTVALVVAHRRNGFFVFRDGWEYVAVLAGTAVALATTGPGRWSLDALLGVDVDGLAAGAFAATAGLLGAAALLVTCWRPATAPAAGDVEAATAPPAA